MPGLMDKHTWRLMRSGNGSTNLLADNPAKTVTDEDDRPRPLAIGSDMTVI